MVGGIITFEGDFVYSYVSVSSVKFYINVLYRNNM